MHRWPGILELRTATTLRRPSRTSRSFRLSRSFFSWTVGTDVEAGLRRALASLAASNVRSRAGFALVGRAWKMRADNMSKPTCLQHATNPRYRLHPHSTEQADSDIGLHKFQTSTIDISKSWHSRVMQPETHLTRRQIFWFKLHITRYKLPSASEEAVPNYAVSTQILTPEVV